MAEFTVRVELHGATSDDYEKLHESMGARGYSREVISDDGQWFNLPTAEYVASKSYTATQIRDEVRVVASAISQSNWVLVTESKERSWYLSTK
ncbi:MULTISPECIES: hypothetical protein [Enterobacterales]|jgi:hypothetical protein|uniref:hypothetical protein n=1 Tax=Enterobacterales TaxID=91347 RepID=UPI000561AE4D|nr:MULTISPECIES: hypothetical protein [Enterobacterales]KAJ9430492.1 hypothetical protein PMI39_023305 [Pantoea sp. YR343]MBB3307132.1 hypothetical protein [Enterobacter sp. Sphag1F]NYI15544.1 hypothetical protein [Enterobacter sp. Sphag71]